MNYKNLLLIAFLGILLLQFLSATHYILGTVENAKDGTSANGHTVFLWNPTQGTNDNLTDIIGISGNSGENNNYSIDCELLSNSCEVSDTLSLKIIDNGDDYVSEIRNVIVTENGFDIVEYIILNSPPTVSLISPSNKENISNNEINFNCSVNDADSNLENVTLYGNWSGGWHANETKNITENQNYVLFTKTLIQGNYYYGCKATDNLSSSNFSQQNLSFTVDLSRPSINSVIANESYFYGAFKTIRINCSVTDEILGVNKVIIQAISPEYTINYTGNLLTENTYYSDILVNQTGSWNFNCIANDSAGNENNLTKQLFYLFSLFPELYINYPTISLNNSNPIENQTISINASIENLGGMDANNLIVSYFIGNPDSGGIKIGEDTINVSSASSQESKISWRAQMGRNNIFVLADYDNSFNEDNETNNRANNTFSINSWQNVYGNITLNKLIGKNEFNLTNWINENNFTGNIFITDSECNVNWMTLQAISKKINGINSENDFSEIDEILKMGNFEDSVSNEFSNNQISKQTADFFIQQKNILNVPIRNSTDSSNFITGMLWDYSDDLGSDGEYDLSDKEDLIFVGKINQKTQGKYGVYDYEITIPAKLREYKTEESSEIYFYYDLN
jgi:hypothetical protein